MKRIAVIAPNLEQFHHWAESHTDLLQRTREIAPRLCGVNRVPPDSVWIYYEWDGDSQ